MTTEQGGLAAELTPAAAGMEVEVEEGFFRRGLEEDQAARDQLRKRLAEMPRWPGLGWAIGVLALAVVAAVLLVYVLPPPQ